MKKLLSLMLVISITSHSYAQKEQTREEKTFEYPTGTLTKRFWIDIKNGNKLEVGLSDLKALAGLKDIDLIISKFLEDSNVLKDSLANERESKRIDYVINENGINTIRILRFNTKGESFALKQGEALPLKFEQDTVHIISTVNPMQHWSLTFYLNQITDLENYLSFGLSAKIMQLQNNPWDWTKMNDGLMHLKADPSISSTLRKGNINQRRYMTITAGVGVQNFKNNFIPSFTEGLIVVDINTNIKREWGLTAEQLFSFSKNSSGDLKTSVDHLISMSFSQSNISNNPNVKKVQFPLSFSIGYLGSQNAEIFEKNTFRINVGKISLWGDRINIEPMIYFNDLFKNISPGIRFVQHIF